MEFIDYYEVMGVEPDADADAIKRAYRKLARKYHPDVSDAGDAEERFKAIGEAWAVLKDPERRAEYDALRTAHAAGDFAGAGGGFRPPPDWRSGAGFESGAWQGAGGDFSDFFEEMFGRRAAGGGPGSGAPGGRGFAFRGEDVQSELAITLDEAYAGTEHALGLRVPVRRGDGSVDFDVKTLKVRVPAGTVDGARLRLRGQGGPGVGGAEAGDLLLEIRIAPHPRFALDGRDVNVTVDVPAWDAALGSRVSVPTLGGTVTLRVPPGSDSGKRLRLRGRGLPGDPPGDQYATLRVTVGGAPDDEARAAWERLRALHGGAADEGGTGS